MTALESIKKRRTCRNFTEETVPPNAVKEIVEAGREAPVSKVSDTLIQISVVRNKKALDMIESGMKNGGVADTLLASETRDTLKIVNSAVNTKPSKNKVGKGYFYGASTLIIVSHKIMSEARESALLIAAQNVACVIENMLLAATELELGSAYLCSIIEELNENEGLKKTLKIPATFRPMGACAIGYDSGEYSMPKAKRSRVSYV
jgi:nitroreductase